MEEEGLNNRNKSYLSVRLQLLGILFMVGGEWGKGVKKSGKNETIIFFGGGLI